MGILDPIVLSKPVWSMNVRKTEQFERRSLGRRPVCHDALRLNRLIAQETTEKLQRRSCVPPPLDHDVQDLPFVIDSSPQIHPPGASPTDHFVQVPSR